MDNTLLTSVEETLQEITEKYHDTQRIVYGKMLANGTPIFPGIGRRPAYKDPDTYMGCE